MKKILTGVLALSLLMGLLAGCGKKAEKSDFETISAKGSMVVGMTIFEPMNYYDADGNFVGFDTELAQAVGKKLGLDVKFQEIEWDNKVIELNSGNIDMIWNGMTIKEDLKPQMDFSIPYSGNMQVPVIARENADKYNSIDAINTAAVTVAAEAGSAGEDNMNTVFPDANRLTVAAQRDCLTELLSGTIDVGVIDYVMADASIGEGTSFDSLQIVDGIELGKEEYGIGLRKGSDMTQKINDALRELVADGTVAELAAKYPSVMVILK